MSFNIKLENVNKPNPKKKEAAGEATRGQVRVWRRQACVRVYVRCLARAAATHGERPAAAPLSVLTRRGLRLSYSPDTAALTPVSSARRPPPPPPAVPFPQRAMFIQNDIGLFAVT